MSELANYFPGSQHFTRCPGAASRGPGFSLKQRVFARGQRGAKAHPGVSPVTLFTSPRRTAGVRPAGVGVAEPKSTNAAKVTVSNLAGAVVITPNEDPELVEQTDVAAAGVPKTFSAEGSWVTYHWYVDTVEQAGETGADFEFNEAAGVYEITVVVTDVDGVSWSGSCRVTVK